MNPASETRQNHIFVPINAKRQITVIEPLRQQTRKLRVAAYARVSSDSADQINSFISQMRHYTAIINENSEWEFVDIYADEGLTGLTTEKRGEFQRMMADCRKGKIDRILVKSISRFCRNTEDCLKNVRELKKLGVNILFEKENIDTAHMTNEMFLAFHGARAQKESQSISDNVRYGNRMRMSNGTYVVSSAPFGYRYSTGQFVIDEEQAAVVRDIYASYLEGKTIASIVEELNERQAAKKRGATWWHTTILYTLTNVVYIGDMIWQKSYSTNTLPIKRLRNYGEKDHYYVRESHPAIIGREEFEKVQQLIKIRREMYYNGRKEHRHHYSGKIICEECGKTFKNKNAYGKSYWVCRTHDRNKNRCSMQRLSENELDDMFIRLYNTLRKNTEYIFGEMIEQLESARDRRFAGNAKIIEINSEIADLAEQILVLNRLKLKSLIDQNLFLVQTNDLNHKISMLRSEKRRIMESGNAESTVEKTKDLMKIFSEGPEFLDKMDAGLFTCIIERIVVTSPERIIIRLRNGLELVESTGRRDENHDCH